MNQSKNSNLNTIGVIGAGVMGVGVTQDLADSGFEILLLDINDKILDQAMTNIHNGLRLTRMFERDTPRDDVETVLSRIKLTTAPASLKRADFVIENVVEKPDVKHEVFTWLDKYCQPHCCMAANTSAVSITRIGSWTERADKVLGMHFMNPVPMKKTVEVIRGYHTTDETIGIAESLLEGMGKEAVVVNDAPGFVSNRVLMLTINEAINLLQDQVASAEQVDKIFKECFGHKMGPLETADLIGLDTILYSIEVLYESFSDSKYRPSQLLKKMVDAGLYGRKNGQGFYKYPVQ